MTAESDIKVVFKAGYKDPELLFHGRACLQNICRRVRNKTYKSTSIIYASTKVQKPEKVTINYPCILELSLKSYVEYDNEVQRRQRLRSKDDEAGKKLVTFRSFC